MPQSPSSSTILRLSSQLSQLSELRPFLRNAVPESASQPALFDRMLLAINEAATNAITHGNGQDPAKMVEIVVARKDNRLSITVSDEGRGFNPHSLPDPTDPNKLHATHGRGVYLMQQLCDEVLFTNGGRTVTLQFEL